ncbi:fasciclin-2-like isoform X2 [Daphnia carinata]|uniref:fasciclin-2-like isoform X2 n=1 Tax=Daphnia carinata TaxID=120202 RepID=UPI0028685C49|nr:fasciclin-2-like isoform X2 [Daphnia carinata]
MGAEQKKFATTAMRPISSSLMAAVYLIAYLCSLAGAQEARLVILPDGGNLIRPVGANIVLTCKGEVPDPDLISDLRWLGPDGRDLPNGDRISSEELVSDVGRILFIKGLQEADSGKYTCSAVYTSSQRLEAHVNLTTIVGITWEDAPTEQSAIFGQPYKVRCVVRANPPATIDWQKNGVGFPTNNQYVIENDGVLIREVSLEDDTYFTCRARVQTTGQLEDRRIRVEVFIPPEFMREPVNTSIVEGEGGIMECQASGKPDPVYTWLDRNNQNLNLNRERFIVDEQTGRLTIMDTKRTDEGEIKCLVENRAGKIQKTAYLKVIMKPAVVEYLNASGIMGREVSLTCKASGDPLPEVTFLKEGTLIPYTLGVQNSDDRIIVDTSREGEYAQARLVIRDLMRSDDGLYACIAKNSGGNYTKNGHITVEFPPSFALTPMREAWSWDNHLVNLTCRAESIPNATVSWFLNGRNLETDYNIRMHAFNGESTITVTPVDLSYYGTYRCLAMNIHGKDEHAIELREARPPGPLLQVKFETITATTITFNFIGPVDHGGLPIEAFSVQYKLAGQVWDEKPLQRVWPVGGHNQYYNLHDSMSHASTDIPYILENLEPQTMYTFRFAAKNQVGYGEWSRDETHTMPKRAAPEEPYIIAKTENKIVSTPYPDRYELLWSAPPNNGEPIDYFEVAYYPVRNTSAGLIEAGQLVRTQVPYPANVRFEMKNLKADTIYRIELRAHNVIGFSAPAEILLRTAKDAATVELGTTTTALPRETASPSQPQSNTIPYVIIGVIVAILVFIALIIDVSCYFVNKKGLIYVICNRSGRNKGSGRKGSNKNSALMEGGKDEHNDEKTPLREVTVEFQDASRDPPNDVQQQKQQTAQVDQPSPTLIKALRFAGGKLHKTQVTARWPTNNPHNTGLLATDDRSIGRGPTSREPHQPLNRRFEPLHSDI